ncbi:hypothetical protein D3C72_1573560 [compost metagenome]
MPIIEADFPFANFWFLSNQKMDNIGLLRTCDFKLILNVQPVLYEGVTSIPVFNIRRLRICFSNIKLESILCRQKCYIFSFIFLSKRLVGSIDHRNIMVSTLHRPDTVSVIAKGLFGIGADAGINEQWLLIFV